MLLGLFAAVGLVMGLVGLDDAGHHGVTHHVTGLEEVEGEPLDASYNFV